MHIVTRGYGAGGQAVFHGLIWDQPVVQDEATTFIPTITGAVSRVSKVDYWVDGSPTYTGLAYNQSFDHTFTGSGTHTIMQRIHLTDGKVIDRLFTIAVSGDNIPTYIFKRTVTRSFQRGTVS